MPFSVYEQHAVIDRLRHAEGYFTISLDVKCSCDVDPLNKYTPGARFSSMRDISELAAFTFLISSFKNTKPTPREAASQWRE